MARKTPKPPRVIQLKDSDKLTQYLNDLLSETQNSVKSAARHGISNTVNQLIQTTINEISRSGFNSQSSRQYGVPLYMGVRGAMVKNEVAGLVHILGDTKHNDGTWRLRFFNAPTKNRVTRKGYNRGVVGGWYFFNRATSDAESVAVANVQTAIEKTIDELNQ